MEDAYPYPDPPDVDGVLRILRAEFGEGAVRLDDASDSMERSIAAHQGSGGGVVVLLTSKAALSRYDPVHPERLVCIAISFPGPGSVSYSVVVNNREFQGASQFARALRLAASVTGASCVVCLDRPADRKGRRLELWMCPHCRSGVCLRCERKMLRAKEQAGGVTDEARRCPSCRRWQLTGDSYGGASPPNPPPALCDAVGGGGGGASPPDGVDVDGFVDALAALDGGAVEVVLRSGLTFVDSVGFTRLSGTDRYAPGSSGRIKHVRRRLSRFVRDEARRGASVSNVYVFRPTWRIDPVAEKPVVEASAFVLLRGAAVSQLLQLRPDAWIDVLGEARRDAPDAHHLKVVLPGVPVGDFPVPPHVLAALDEIALAALGSGADRLTLAVEFTDGDEEDEEEEDGDRIAPYTGFNADAEVVQEEQERERRPSLRITTMHPLMFEATLGIHLGDGQRPSVLFAKLWPPKENEVIAFRFDRRSCVRIGPDETSALLLRLRLLHSL